MIQNQTQRILYNDVIEKLQNYMLDENNIEKSIKPKFFLYKNKQNVKQTDNTNVKPNVKQNIILTAKEKEKQKPTIFIPQEKDTLFWCFYIIKYGEIKYETINNKNEVITKQIKIDFIQKIRENKKTIKIYKLDSISNIESNLVNDNLICAKTFLALCVLENINIIFITKKTYFELLMNDSNEIYIVYQIENNMNEKYNKYNIKYGFELGNIETINNIKDTLYKVDKIDKPILAISSYTIKELLDICNKLAIETINTDTNKLKSKKELYEKIIQYF